MELFAPTHLLLVLAICLLVFGPKKLPELSRGLGEAIRGFKTAVNEASNAVTKDEQKPVSTSAAASQNEPPKA